MIALTDVAAKLQEILNDKTNPLNANDFSFVVKSQGYHLDSIADKKKGINLIPVFLTMVGGEYNPVPNLHQANFTYGVDIWFPVRFKETFYRINEYLEETFVGKKLEIGGKVALCNIGVAEYGEIVGLHLDQFEEWVEDTYAGSVHLFKKEHDISEEYMNMHFNIFATTLGDGFMLGNDIKYKLSATFPILKPKTIQLKVGDDYSIVTRKPANDRNTYKAWYSSELDFTFYTTSDTYLSINEDTVFYYWDEDAAEMKVANDKFYSYIEFSIGTGTTNGEVELVWDSGGTGGSISPVSEQLIGIDKYVRNTQNITNFNKSIVVYPNPTSSRYNFWDFYLIFYNQQMLNLIQDIKITKEYKFRGRIYNFDFTQIVLSVNENIALGQPLSFTITFGD